MAADSTHSGTPNIPEPPGKSALEGSDTGEHGASPPAAPPSHGGGRNRNAPWWVIPDFGYLVIWWVAVIGYYVVFNSISGRDHNGLIDPEMISGGWYAILISGLIGAFYAKRSRPLWFLISIVLALLILLLMLLGLGALKNLTNA